MTIHFDGRFKMGLFDKKFCSVCGGKIGLLGNRKLEDGNLCKDCAGKLSPWFSERRHSTVESIKEQLAYREANRAEVSAFHTTRTMGERTKVLLDEDARKFMVTSAGNLQDANPDVLKFEDVTGCDLDIDERKVEQKMKNAEGKEVSYTPPRYKYEYNMSVVIYVNNPYFDDMRFQINSSTLHGKTDPDYRRCEAIGLEIRKTMNQIREGIREGIEAAAAPKTAVTCPSCGASTIPDANGCCEYCGAALKV
jgi:hypothetical protein